MTYDRIQSTVVLIAEYQSTGAGATSEDPMPKEERLSAAEPWTQLSSTRKDWDEADPRLLKGMYAQLHLIRAFEETVLELASEGLVNGPAHSSIGQEGGAVGSVAALRPRTPSTAPTAATTNSSPRRWHTSGRRSRSRSPSPTVSRTVLRRTLAEILGLADGYCRGRGGSIHLQWLEAGALGSNAIVGGGVPIGAGNAWSQQRAGDWRHTVSYFGDGAVNIGSVLETMNLAAAWGLPFCFFIENNMYAVSTHVRRGDEGEPALRSRPGLRYPIVARRRNGPARGVPGNERGRRRHAQRRRARR